MHQTFDSSYQAAAVSTSGRSGTKHEADAFLRYFDENTVKRFLVLSTKSGDASAASTFGDWKLRSQMEIRNTTHAVFWITSYIDSDHQCYGDSNHHLQCYVYFTVEFPVTISGCSWCIPTYGGSIQFDTAPLYRSQTTAKSSLIVNGSISWPVSNSHSSRQVLDMAHQSTAKLWLNPAWSISRKNY